MGTEFRFYKMKRVERWMVAMVVFYTTELYA